MTALDRDRGRLLALLVPGSFLLLVIACVVLGPTMIDRGPDDGPWEAFSRQHLLGTDQLGRDMLHRLLEGGRVSLSLAFVVAVLAFLLGLAGGLVAAFFGGIVDILLSRLVDILLSLPPLILAILVVSMLGNSIPVLIAVLSIFESLRVYRLARALAMDIMREDFILAARLRGEGLLWLLVREIAPNAVLPLVAELALRFVLALLFLSSLSFLGLGVPPPQPDWGGMVRENAAALGFGLPAPIVPAAVIALVALSVNRIADALVAGTQRDRGPA